MEPKALLTTLEQQHDLKINIYPLKEFTVDEIYDKVQSLVDNDHFLLSKIMSRRRKSKQKTVQKVLSYLNNANEGRTYSLHGTTDLKLMEIIRCTKKNQKH